MFTNRSDAGRRLASGLRHLRATDLVVLGLPRGGVPVAYEVARSLGAPLDVIVVRKLGVPFQPELAMGAVGEGDAVVLNPEVVRLAHLGVEDLVTAEQRERAEVEARSVRYRQGHPRELLEGRTALIVDDGIATGATARAACEVARSQGAARIVLAVPVGPPDVEQRFRDAADDVVCLEQPRSFHAVGQFYADFAPVEDAEVTTLLHRRADERTGGAAAAPGLDEEVEIAVGGVVTQGRLTVPPGARGLVLFAHGSGSSRHSPRNRHVAGVLNSAGLATLLLDLLTAGEEHDRSLVFDIELLADRLAEATRRTAAHPAVVGLPVGYFGASTGAAAALWAAAAPDLDVFAVVSRGGRPDLAMPRLDQVRAPTLFVVGGRDATVLDLNRRAQKLLECENDLVVVPGATHLFEEPGTLDQVAVLARDWFSGHLPPRDARE